MPYRRAPLFILLLLASTLVAFWPAYYSRLSTAPWAFHLHGVTSSIWLALLAAQAASIHRRRLAWHRLAGRASLVFFPVYLAGMAGVFHSMAAASPTDPFYAIYGARLAMMDGIAAVMIAWLYHRALIERRDPQRHAHAMMATPLFLIPPIAGRLVGRLVPPLAIHGPAEFWKFAWAVEIGNLVALVVAALLWRRARRGGALFLGCAAVMVLQALVFPIAGELTAWQATFAAAGSAAPAWLLPATAAIGALIVWHGWTAGAPRPRSAPLAA